jgi:hypothetical protein
MLDVFFLYFIFFFPFHNDREHRMRECYWSYLILNKHPKPAVRPWPISSKRINLHFYFTNPNIDARSYGPSLEIDFTSYIHVYVSNNLFLRAFFIQKKKKTKQNKKTSSSRMHTLYENKRRYWLSGGLLCHVPFQNFARTWRRYRAVNCTAQLLWFGKKNSPISPITNGC